MQIGLIPTENTQLIDVHISSGQIKFGKLYPGKNDIMLAWTAKKAAVKVLEMGTAQA